MFQACRPMGRLIYLALAVVLTSSIRVAAAEEGSAAKPGKATSFPAAKPTAAKLLARAASPTPQSGPILTDVVDTIYRADGTDAQGVLVITWPAFVEANGTAVAEGTLDVTLGASGALNVALAPNAGNKPGADKKDAAMSFLQNALSTVDAVAAREIIDPEKFKNGISMIVDGTVACLNASTWCKKPPAASSQPSA
jgi:hypothetical protein